MQQPKTLSTFYARLKPFDPKREHAMKVYVFGMRRFDAGTWLPVDEPLAEALRGVRQSYNDELSPLAFEVLSGPEAKNMGLIPEAEGLPASGAPKVDTTPETTAGEPRETEAEPRTPRNKKGREA